jgi:hypothetical protein
MEIEEGLLVEARADNGVFMQTKDTYGPLYGQANPRDKPHTHDQQHLQPSKPQPPNPRNRRNHKDHKLWALKNGGTRNSKPKNASIA